MPSNMPLELAAATFAVHARALEVVERDWASARPSDVDPRHEPMPLGDAVKILLHYDTSPERALGSAFVAWAVRREQTDMHTTPNALLRHANQLLNPNDQVPGAASPEEVYLARLNQLLGLATCVQGFSWQSVYDVSLQSTKVTVNVWVDRPISDYRTIVDPQNWSLVAPDTFLNAFRMRDRRSPDDPFSVPPAQPTTPGDPWDGFFFEHAQWAINGLAFSNFRNVLEITYEPGVLMEYELHENLTQEVLGFKDLGGLDIDSGTVSFSTVNVGSGQLTLMQAVKKIRFCKPDLLKGYLNWLNLPLLTYWMLQSIVGGACMPPPTPPTPPIT